jgi:hypothetical protein
MDFDHRDEKEKSFIISGSYNRKKEVLLKEIKKCDIICSNCHRIRTKKRKKRLPL